MHGLRIHEAEGTHVPANESVFHYLPVSSVEVGWGAYLAGIGRVLVHPGEKYPPNDHPRLYRLGWRSGRTLPEFQMLLISDGRGEFETEATGRVEISSGNLLFLFPDVWHRYKPDPDIGWTERWISFNGDLAHSLMGVQQLGPERSVTVVSDESCGRLAGRFDDLLEKVHANPTVNSLLFSIQVLSLASDGAELARSTSMADAGSGGPGNQQNCLDQKVVRALEIIWTHSDRPLSVDEIAKKLHVTRRTLDRRFKEATNRTVLEEINRCRLARAKRLLRETQLPVKTVSHLAGFASQERLRVSMLADVGLSPSEFRTQHQAISHASDELDAGSPLEKG